MKFTKYKQQQNFQFKQTTKPNHHYTKHIHSPHNIRSITPIDHPWPSSAVRSFVRRALLSVAANQRVAFCRRRWKLTAPSPARRLTPIILRFFVHVVFSGLFCCRFGLFNVVTRVRFCFWCGAALWLELRLFYCGSWDGNDIVSVMILWIVCTFYLI